MNQTPSDLAAFLQKHVRPYRPDADDYERPAFAADIKEGKNDPIYNAHSYHTKVPPRSIIPYILHYTKPGDLILDLFCGSGMTGVAAQMCNNPPTDILDQFPELRDRVGPRACVLNDLSPIACHIAYNYNAPVDVIELRHEFEKLKTAVKDDFDWLYGTEHYEPAVGRYDPSNADVASRLKKAPATDGMHTLLGGDERNWELLTKAEVETRLGYAVTELPRDDDWDDITLAKIKQWICIPASIQYTVWSDVYLCEGNLTIEEPTGKISTRGKNAGKPITRRRSVHRGCGERIVLWDTAHGDEDNAVEFECPKCKQKWEKVDLPFETITPILVDYTFTDVGNKRRRLSRKVSAADVARAYEAKPERWGHWYPQHKIYPFRELMTMSANKRGVRKTSDFYTSRNLSALALLWNKIGLIESIRVQRFAAFGFTGIIPYCCRKQNYGGGGGGMSGTLYLPSFHQEKNVLEVFERKIDKLIEEFSGRNRLGGDCYVNKGSAHVLNGFASDSVDYIFTDPPFGGNIFYADASIMWESWLNDFTDEKREMVYHRRSKQQRESDGYVFKTLDSYERDMGGAFSECFRVLKPGRWCTVEFNNSDGKVFDAIKRAALSAGFEIENMLLLDKSQKSFKQVQGAKGEQDVVDKDVLFNLIKPAVVRNGGRGEDRDLEQQVADAVRQHLQTLPDRIGTEPGKYSDDHRTTATINSMLMNTLIPNGVSVDRLNLPFIERVCGRYFRKIGQRWYLRGEAIGSAGWLGEEIRINDELTAIAWLRRQLRSGPKMVGELKPVWMRATGLLQASVSANLDLERLLVENFWHETATNRWREPTPEEREKMNDDHSLRVFHDADRLVTGTLGRAVGNPEVCEWIKVLYGACRELEDGGEGAAAAHLGFDKMDGFRLIVRLSQRLTSEGLEAKSLSDARKQAAVAGRRLAESAEATPAPIQRRAMTKKDEGPTLFDLRS